MFEFVEKLDCRTSMDIFITNAELVKRVDDRLECAQQYYHPVEETILDVLAILAEYTTSSNAFILCKDETLETRLFKASAESMNSADEKRLIRDYSRKKTTEPFVSGKYYVCNLDVDGHSIGAVGIEFPEDMDESRKLREKFYLQNFCEEIDNYILSEYSSSRKHMIKMQIGDALENRIFSDGLADTIKILKENIDFSTLILFYYDENDEDLSTLKYFIYSEKKGFFDPYHFFDRELHFYIMKNRELIISGKETMLLKMFEMDTFMEEYLICGIKNVKQLGKLLISSATSIFDKFEKELLDVFVSFIQQRVIDFNKEWRSLSQFFSVTQRIKLLETDDYHEKYLTPRLKEFVIIYSDISSFTFFSEQVLKTPKQVTKMFDIWASGVLNIIWKNGGCCDKFVGDCVIVFFGPPFFNSGSYENCRNALKCAVEIREFTKSLIKRREKCFTLIRESDERERFGVSTGINFGELNVGVIGPNDDYTGFGSVMNNASRIQGLARKDEILMLKSFTDIIGDSIVVEGPYYSVLKNVKDEAEYYKFKDFKHP